LARKRTWSVDPDKVYTLFDDEERAAYHSEFKSTAGQIFEGHQASDLLHWIVQYRSPFIQMASGIGKLLTTLEASIKGNIEFIVATSDGAEFELAFGPQIRRLVQAAAHWEEQTEPQIETCLRDTQRAIANLCAACTPTLMQRDSQIGAHIRSRAQASQDPGQRMRADIQAGMLMESRPEYSPTDAGLMQDLVKQMEPIDQRLGRSFMDDPAAAHILTAVDRMLDSARTTADRASAQQSRQAPMPNPRLNNNRVARAVQQLEDLEAALHAAKVLESTGETVIEAMALALWKERWRIYELWLFCAICALLVKASVRVNTMNRIVNGRWTLKFSRDPSPVLSCVIGSSTLEIFYQYFEKGDEEGNMPDIAVRSQEAGKWLLILDPKMGRTYRNAELASVCLRYAAAFDAPLSIVANYFPDEPSNEELASKHRAMLCHGLRPNNFSTIAGALRSSFAGAGLALPPSAAICILIDASGSMSASLKATEQLVLRVIEAAPSLDAASAWIGFFSDSPPDLRPLDQFLNNPEFPQPLGETNYKTALMQGADKLVNCEGEREIWLFGDGVDSEGADMLAEMFTQRQIRLLAWTGPSESIESLCELTGGRFSLVT